MPSGYDRGKRGNQGNRGNRGYHPWPLDVGGPPVTSALDDPRWAAPADVAVATAKIGASTDAEVARLLPAWSTLPERFQRLHDPWCDLVAEWFHEGLVGRGGLLVARPGVNRGRALGHCSAVLRSFVPGHHEKIAGVALLCSRWFEPLPAGVQP